MADVEDAPAMPVPAPAPAPAPGPATTPTPAPNPDAQTTVNDFLDYTEFYPSDLVRSLTLIGDLDATYAEAVQQVHELTSLYCKLPQLPDRERPDPALLRKQIAQQLTDSWGSDAVRQAIDASSAAVTAAVAGSSVAATAI